MMPEGLAPEDGRSSGPDANVREGLHASADL